MGPPIYTKYIVNYYYNHILMPKPLKIAHRGFGAKDNTLLAFRYAVHAKFDVLELDLHQTKDKRLILCHDLFIGPYNVENTPYDTLKMYESDLITLDGFFKYFPSRNHRVYLDLKGRDEIVATLYEYVLSHNVCVENIMVASFNKYHLEALHYSQMSWKIGFITCNTLRPNEYESILYTADFLVVHYNTLSNELMTIINHLDKKLFTYTCDNEYALRYILKYKVHGIVSDILLEDKRI